MGDGRSGDQRPDPGRPGDGPGPGRRGSDGRRAARRYAARKLRNRRTRSTIGGMGAEERPGAARQRADRVQVGHGRRDRLLRGLAAAPEHAAAALCLQLLVDARRGVSRARRETLGVLRQLGTGQVRTVLARLRDTASWMMVAAMGARMADSEHQRHRHAVLVVAAAEHRRPERHVAQEADRAHRWSPRSCPPACPGW